MISEKERKEFETLAKPLIKWLNEQKNPHMMIVIDPSSAQAFSGECALTTLEYIKD